MIHSYRLSSAVSNGPSAWLPLQTMEGLGFALGLALIPSHNANLQATIEAVLDNLTTTRRISWSADTAKTTITLTDVGHGLSSDDEVGITLSSDAGLNSVINTSRPVTVVDDDTYTVTVDSALTASSGIARVVSYRVVPHDDLTAQSGRVAGNYQFAVTAVRINITNWVAGKCDLVVTSLLGA